MNNADLKMLKRFMELVTHANEGHSSIKLVIRDVFSKEKNRYDYYVEIESTSKPSNVSKNTWDKAMDNAIRSRDSINSLINEFGYGGLVCIN